MRDFVYFCRMVIIEKGKLFSKCVVVNKSWRVDTRRVLVVLKNFNANVFTLKIN